MNATVVQHPPSCCCNTLATEVRDLRAALSGIPLLCEAVDRLERAITAPRPKPAVAVSPALLTLVGGA
jgi:hypothetical protein